MAELHYPTRPPAANPSSAAGTRVSYPLPAMATLWDELRGDFPGLDGKVYLNAAATSLPPRPVREAVAGFYRELEEGGDRHWDGWLERREAVRGSVARFVGA